VGGEVYGPGVQQQEKTNNDVASFPYMQISARPSTRGLLDETIKELINFERFCVMKTDGLQLLPQLV